VPATVRFAAELGYQVTMVKDATADYSDEEMHAALDINIPNYASAIVTTQKLSTRSLLFKPQESVRGNSGGVLVSLPWCMSPVAALRVEPDMSEVWGQADSCPTPKRRE
jgi:hypothetical protein